MAASSFPEFITSRRRELELTLGDVAGRLGVSPITVSNWSTGETRPKPENLVALADLLEVPAEDLADMAGIRLSSPEPSVNLMPKDAALPAEPDIHEPLTEETDVSEPIAELRVSNRVEPTPEVADEVTSPSEPAADVEIPAPVATGDDAPTPPPEDDVVPIPFAVDDEAPTPDVASEPPAEAAGDASDAVEQEPAEAAEEAAPDDEKTPESVPAEAAPPSEPTDRPRRRPVVRRPRRAPAAAERPVTTLPLTYIEDPKQLTRYRIRWTLTVVILAIMFFILLWASRELLSALSEVKQAVTPGGIGGG
jgi:transcriptional regulator with XRE-family HTH domain